MGHHYVNPPLLADSAIDPLRPEILLYVPRAGGGLELVGGEYSRADEDQNVTTQADRPSLFGRAFDGPMPGHAPAMPVHYDLHVWLFASNPSGVFAPWNPSRRCA